MFITLFKDGERSFIAGLLFLARAVMIYVDGIRSSCFSERLNAVRDASVTNMAMVDAETP